MEMFKKSKEQPKKEKIFDNLFNMAYEPVIVDKKAVQGAKKTYTTIFNALNNADEHIMIKINPGIYNERLQIKKKDLKIQAADISQNSILINQQHPNIVINLPETTDKVYFQSLKLVNTCQNNARHEIINGGFEGIKKQDYLNFQIHSGMNTCLYVRRGIVQLDQCKISLAAYHNRLAALPCIVVERDGCLILNRSEIRGSSGTVGIFSNGGRVIMKETMLKDHGIVGILFSTNNRISSLTIKNCSFLKCNEGIVLNGPFESIIQNNTISESPEAGIVIYNGHPGKVTNNEIKQCRIGIEIKNSSASVMKNTVSNNDMYGIHIKSTSGLLCKPILKFNTINQNSQGGLLVQGSLNTACIWNNEFNYNNKFGIKVNYRASPHIFMNKICKTLGNAVHICQSCSAFVEKNQLGDSLQCNLVLQGPDNINNFVFRNKIRRARGEGIFCIFGEKFTIKDNEIYENYNGIVSMTGVENIQDNNLSTNQRNGILLIGDNNVAIVGNELQNNKKAGIFIRDSSIGRIQDNCFNKNGTEIVIENDDSSFNKIQQSNIFEKDYDIRIPKNYKCQLI